MTYSYGTSRAKTHAKQTARHAVDELSHTCGAMDTACGRPVRIYLGLWIPGHPNNCVACTTALARDSEEVHVSPWK